jgi:2-polyprenyl-3-methyl-5-hydroxy-6-metoxy-1,4-benzoquinol methylase
MKNIEKSSSNKCRICGSLNLKIFAHTATCSVCGVLLNFPYAPVREVDFLNRPILSQEEHDEVQKVWLDWYVKSGERNHHNFTHMACFALSDNDRNQNIDVLDYGGGGGQFALVMRSLFPRARTHVVDMQDDALLDINKYINTQILFKNFDADGTRFDVIFMNDVYEHLSDPIGVLEILRGKLKPGGRIFIDTPCKFWLYYSFKIIFPGLQAKILKGTVDHDHQQIWSQESFKLSAQKAGFQIVKFRTLSEYTQGASYYLDSMGIKNPILRLAGSLYIFLAPLIAKNKIMAVLRPMSK